MEHTLAVSVATFVITQLVKWLPQIPIVRGESGKIRTVAGGIALVAAIFHALASGDLSAVITPEWIAVAGQWLGGWLLAHVGWKFWKYAEIVLKLAK